MPSPLGTRTLCGMVANGRTNERERGSDITNGGGSEANDRDQTKGRKGQFRECASGREREREREPDRQTAHNKGIKDSQRAGDY